MLTVTRDDGFVISADPGRIDVDRVHHWLSTDTYWATGRPRELVERSIGNSRTYGVYRSDGEQVAVARVVTDEATFAWLCDVYVDRAVRGRGLARWLVEAIRDDLEAVGVRRILLGTWDAHGVYEKVGFAPLDRPERWMEYDRRPPL